VSWHARIGGTLNRDNALDRSTRVVVVYVAIPIISGIVGIIASRLGLSALGSLFGMGIPALFLMFGGFVVAYKLDPENKEGTKSLISALGIIAGIVWFFIVVPIAIWLGNIVF